MRILIVSDAWHPQVNGVVRTLSMVAAEATALGHVVEVIGPDRFRTVALPTYASIRVALAPGRWLAAMRALAGDRAACRAHAERFSWRACADAFLANLVMVGSGA